MFLAITISLVLILVGALIVIGGAMFLRRYLFRGISLRLALVFSQSALIVLCIVLYPTDVFCPPGPFDDVYASYMVIPGIHIYLPAAHAAVWLQPHLMKAFSFHTASLLIIIFIPGFICLILGAVQWFLIGTLWQRQGLTRRCSEP
jgi:hypothetical protein